MSQSSKSDVADLVAAGRLRAGLFIPQYTVQPGTGEIRAHTTGHVAVEVARALAQRIGVELQLLGYPSPADVATALTGGACDLAMLGLDATRARELDFSPPIMEFDFTYLVPAGSTIGTSADADRPGHRIVVAGHHASTLALRRIVRHATIIDADLPDAAFDMLRAGKADAFAFPRIVLLEYAPKLAGSRVLDDAYGFNRAAFAIAKGHAGRLAYISSFIEEAKATGLVQRIIDAARLPGFRVARSDAQGD